MSDVWHVLGGGGGEETGNGRQIDEIGVKQTYTQ